MNLIDTATSLTLRIEFRKRRLLCSNCLAVKKGSLSLEWYIISYTNRLRVTLKTFNKHGLEASRVGQHRRSLLTKTAPNLKDGRQDPNRDCQDA